ncbi:hypothetical protein SAMN04244572_04920, partial [Azotobacter beijerinckii]
RYELHKGGSKRCWGKAPIMRENLRSGTYETAGTVDWKAIAEEMAQGKEIPADLIQKHQGDSGCRTRMTVDPHFNPNQPAPEPRIRKPAQPEPEEQPPFAAGFWF